MTHFTRLHARELHSLSPHLPDPHALHLLLTLMAQIPAQHLFLTTPPHVSHSPHTLRLLSTRTSLPYTLAAFTYLLDENLYCTGSSTLFCSASPFFSTTASSPITPAAFAHPRHANSHYGSSSLLHALSLKLSPDNNITTLRSVFLHSLRGSSHNIITATLHRPSSTLPLPALPRLSLSWFLAQCFVLTPTLFSAQQQCSLYLGWTPIVHFHQQSYNFYPLLDFRSLGSSLHHSLH